jgi:hypothetical protein
MGGIKGSPERLAFRLNGIKMRAIFSTAQMIKQMERG